MVIPSVAKDLRKIILVCGDLRSAPDVYPKMQRGSKNHASPGMLRIFPSFLVFSFTISFLNLKSTVDIRAEDAIPIETPYDRSRISFVLKLSFSSLCGLKETRKNIKLISVSILYSIIHGTFQKLFLSFPVLLFGISIKSIVKKIG